MQFLCALNLRTEALPPGVVTPELVELEIQSVLRLLALGTLGDAWLRNDRIGIFILFDGLSESECRGVIETLPFSRAGVLDLEMIVPVEPYRVAYAAHSVS